MQMWMVRILDFCSLPSSTDIRENLSQTVTSSLPALLFTRCVESLQAVYRLTAWLPAWLTDWLTDWLAEWLTDCHSSHHSFTSPIIYWFTYSLTLQVTTKGKGGGEHYLYDQAAMDIFMKALPDNASPSIQRFKGLGKLKSSPHTPFFHIFQSIIFTWFHTFI